MKHTLQIIVFALLWLGVSGSLLAQCSQPSNLNVVNLSPTSAQLSWSASSGALNYTLQYRPTTTAVWTTVAAISGTSYNLTGLAESTVYRWRVKANCSTYSSVALFNSGGGGNNTSCSQPSNLNALNLTTTSVSLSWSASPGAFNYTVQYRVNGATAWTTTPSTPDLTMTLTSLQEGTVYQWRVKSSCSAYSSTNSFNTGGGGNNTSCSQPSSLDALNLSPTSVQLSWSEIQEALNYRVQYRVMGTTTWTTSAVIPPTTLTLTLTNLLANTEYQWRVKASCSVYSSIAVFNTSTSGGGSSCSSPSNTNTLAVTPTTASIEWEAVAGALNYDVEYRLIAATTYTAAGTFATAAASLTGLTPGQEYVWRVKANCSPFGSDVQFSTPLTKPAGGIFNDKLAERSIQKLVEFSIFPNPARGGELSIFSEKTGGMVQIMDATGRTILTQTMNEPQENLNIASLKNGMYFVRVQQENQPGKTIKLVVAQ